MLTTLGAAAWRYRGFIRGAITNEFRARLARSRFGTAWLVLQPLAQALIFATVLSSVLAARLPGVQSPHAYTVYLMSGILAWNLFSEIIQRCTTVFIDNAGLMKKMQFPRIALPLISIGSAAVTSIALLLVMIVVFPFLGFGPNVHWLWLPLLLALVAGFAAGLGLILGTLNVFVRDVGQVVAIVLQFWFWITPVVYPASIVPDAFKATLRFNPMAQLVAGFHDVVVYARAPSIDLVWIAVISFGLLLAALGMFRRASVELVDTL